MCYQIMSYIDTHLVTLQRLSDLEEVFHYSYGYLSKLFKRTCGRSLIDYYSERRLEAARAMLLSEHLSVTTVAERMNYASVYSFSRVFKEKYGISPKKYIIQLEINHACDLLRLERYTVTQIAELCNFSDVYFFSRQFKEYTGITPTQFIKKYRSSK
jgi:AraC-like DNA-binding protein